MSILDYLSAALGGGDPEAAGAAAGSQAMEPVTLRYMRDVLSGKIAADNMPRSTYDPGMTLGQNARQPGALDAAMNVAFGVGPGAIRAYHGSPHDFSQFDLSKIGTGEGAQAYGHGLYFAENEGVARGYRDKLALNNQRPVTIQSPFGPLSILEQDPTRPGRMYEVDLHADPERFLNWDKPLAEQNPTVQQMALEQLGHHKRLWEQLGDSQRAQYIAKQEGNPPPDLYAPFSPESSHAWADRGIPGIRYLDQGSRGAGEGSSNYVVFNPSIIEILRKYGIGGLLGGAGAVAASNPYGGQP